jgi:hypothetical protein
MADIRFSDFGSRRRRAGGNAAAFGKCEQPDEVLPKDEKRETNAADENGSSLLRDELLGHRADSFRLII